MSPMLQDLLSRFTAAYSGLVVPISLVTVLLMLVIFAFRKKTHPNAPKEVRIGAPLLGTAAAWNKDPYAVLVKGHKQYGNVFVVNILAAKFTFILGPEAHKFFFKAREDVLSFQTAILYFVGHVLGHDIYANSDWNAISNSLISKGFLKNDRLDKYRAIIAEEVGRATKKWVAAGDQGIDLFASVSELVTAINIRCMLGDELFHEQGRHLASLFYGFEMAASDPVLFMFPWLPSPSRSRMNRMRCQFHAIIREACEKRQKPESMAKYEEGTDYLQLLLNEVGNRIPIQTFCMHILSLLFAGHTNTTGTLAWTIAELARHPDALAKLRQEINEGSRNGQFMDACMKETVRQYSLVTAFRYAAKDIEYGDKVIPSGSVVCISPYYVHHDASIYPEPFEWKPTRWLDAPLVESNNSEGLTASRNRWIADMAFVQFGYGMHKCLGEKFAVQVMQTAWTELFTKYDVSVLHDKLPMPDLVKSLGTPFPKTPLKVRVTPRK